MEKPTPATWETGSEKRCASTNQGAEAMVTKLIRRALGPSIVILIALTGVCLYVWANSVKTQSQPVAYKVLDDPMQTIMKIGIRSGIDEDELRATLRKAADDHQNDPARDLLLSDY